MPPKIFTSWEFYNPRKITWKSKILVSKTNILFQKYHHFQGVTSGNPYISGFFSQLSPPQKKSQSSHSQGVWSQASSQEPRPSSWCTCDANPGLSRSGVFRSRSDPQEMEFHQTAKFGIENPTKPWDHCWGCIFFTPTIYFSSNILSQVF